MRSCVGPWLDVPGLKGPSSGWSRCPAATRRTSPAPRRRTAAATRSRSCRAPEGGGLPRRPVAPAEPAPFPLAQVRRADGLGVGSTAYWEPRPGPAGQLRAVEIGCLARRVEHGSASTPGQAAADEPRLRPAAGGAGDFKRRPPASEGPRGPRRHLRGRAARLVTVLGARRGRSSADSAMYSVIAPEWDAVREAGWPGASPGTPQVSPGIRTGPDSKADKRRARPERPDPGA